MRYVLGSFLLAFWALLIIEQAIVSHHCYAEEGESTSESEGGAEIDDEDGDEPVDPMNIRCLRVKTDNALRDLYLAITKAGFSVKEVVNPGEEPVREGFSATIHSQLGRFTEAILDWKESCIVSGQLTPEEVWLDRETPLWESWRRYLDALDPLLLRGLVHLYHIAFHGEYAVTTQEKEYLNLRTEVINRVLWCGNTKLIDDWEDMYDLIYSTVSHWRKRQSFPFKAQLDKTLEDQVENAFKKKMKRKRNDDEKAIYQNALGLVLAHIKDQEYRGSSASSVLTDVNAMRLRTVWGACKDFSKKVLSSDFVDQVTEKDRLLFPHIAFIHRCLRVGNTYDFARQLLGLAWFHKAMIDSRKAKKTDRRTWRLKIEKYVLSQPVPKTTQSRGVAGVALEPFLNTASPGSPRSPLHKLTGGGVNVTPGKGSPKLHIQTAPVLPLDVVASTIIKTENPVVQPLQNTSSITGKEIKLSDIKGGALTVVTSHPGIGEGKLGKNKPQSPILKSTSAPVIEPTSASLTNTVPSSKEEKGSFLLLVGASRHSPK